MEVVAATASITALLEFATHIIKYVKGAIDAPVQKRKLLTALVQARGLLSALRDLTDEVNDEDWSYTVQSLSVSNGPLSTFKDILEQISRKLGVPTRDSNIANILSRPRWPFDQSSVHGMLSSLEQLKSHFLLAIANDHVRLSMAIRNELHEVHHEITTAFIDTQRRAIVSLSKEQELIVQSLCVENLSRDLNKEDTMEKRVGTEWFLSHNGFKEWHDASSPSSHRSTLVLTGLAGSGKSTICHATQFYLKAWHQSEIDVCVLYFGFQLSQEGCRNKSLVLSNLVQKMILERPYLMEHASAMRVTGGMLTPSESIDLLRRASFDLKHLYLILDGLDEAGGMGCDLLTDLLAIDPPLRILIATRSTPELRQTLQGHATIDTSNAWTFANNLELVKAMLEKDSRVAGYLDHNHENFVTAAKIIAERNAGIYVCSAAMVEFLAKAETKARFERLLYSPPLTLAQMYELMLDDVMHQPPEAVALAKKTLRVLMETAGPVSISQLKSALASESEDTSYVGKDVTEEELFEACIASCKMFVVSVSGDNTATPLLGFAHSSAREFFDINGLPA
ncbi:uncharacterized protein N7518_010008 [Penicillium psychrosexuale]|uniref:uncharacterized protein n=1 Tax=Penicillium psychrosexuale TaxID=1002107 RepID=UPI002545AC97|nr:uncharacterized protein N7518_010008 [Penicillium psychrosexuale]KAJ5781525.1 hypothetical protein N7518_010008 [Penicillium psychrosexuale]